jgi:ribosome-associated protein
MTEREVVLRDGAIRLGQLIKLAGLVGSGGEVKGFLGEQPVLVNGQPEQRRGRQLGPGDVVEAAGERLTLVAPS